MSICAADDGFRISHGHQHQHQCVVSDAVRRIGNTLDGYADILCVFNVDMVVADASCGDVHYAGLAQCKKSGVRDKSLVTDADASVSECQVNICFGWRRLCDSWHDA